jgi:hypothetical protein
MKWMAGALVVTLVVAFFGLLIFRALWVTNQEKHEFAYAFDRYEGKIECFTNSGWIVRTPIRYSVHTIDMRPIQITISANQRVLNAKLVRFDPKGIQTFIEWHGRGAGESMNSPLGEILKCYAFDKANGLDCPFLEVVQEIAPNQGLVVK